MSAEVAALKKFVLEKAKERKLSLRKISADIGITHSYLSLILNGKRPLDVVLGNKLADYFNVQRVVLYRIAGWVDLSDDEELNSRFSEYAKKDKDLAKLFEKILSIDDPKKRKSMIRLMIAGLEE